MATPAYRIQQLSETITVDNNTVFAVEQDGDMSATTKKVSIETLKTVFTGGSALTPVAPIDITDDEISIPVADSNTDGYLSSADWDTFNGKENAGVTVKLDQSTPQTITGGAFINQAVDFDTTPSTSNNVEGRLQWNSTDGTLDLGMSGGDVIQQIGQETFIKVINKTVSQIDNGKAVYFDGRQGTRPKIALARGDAESTSMVIGLTTQDIIADAEGYVTTSGYVRNIKTDYTGTGIWGTTWAEGDLLYISTTDAGVLTNVQPDAPNHSDIVGSVGIVHSNLGSILVSIERHKTLEELSDVNGTALTVTGQIPVWNESTNVFDFNENILDRVPLNRVLVSTASMNELATGFTISGGTTSKTLTIPLDASVSGTNTGDQDLSGLVTISQTSSQTIGDTDHRVTKLWATDITCTNAIAGSVTGNSGTVTNGIYTTSPVTALAAATGADKDKYVHTNASTGALEYSSISVSGYLADTGATIGATSQVQQFISGIATGIIRAIAGSDTTIQIQKADGTSAFTLGLGGGGISSNLSIGNNALSYNTIGTNCIAIGENALGWTSNTNTVCIGNNAGNNGGYNNSVIVGNNAIKSNYGNSLVIIGSSAAELSHCENSVIIGFNSGKYTSGGATVAYINESVMIGNARPLSDSSSNEIIIGINTTGNGSNTCTIGNSSLLRTYLTGVNLKAGTAVAGTAPLKLTTQASGLTSVEQGAFELIGNSLQFTQLAKRMGVAMTQATRTTTTTIENSVTESAALITAEHGANYLEVGKMEEIIITGTLEQRSNPSAILTFRIKYAGSTIHTVATTGSNMIASGSPFLLRVTTTVRSVGASGTMQINSWLECVNEVVKGGSTLANIDTTTAQDTTITAQWGEAAVEDILKVEQGRVLCIEPNK